MFGSPTWARTRDLRINSPALYRLSYRGTTNSREAKLYEVLRDLSIAEAPQPGVTASCHNRGRRNHALPHIDDQRSSSESFSFTSLKSSASGSGAFVFVMLGQPLARS